MTTPLPRPIASASTPPRGSATGEDTTLPVEKLTRKEIRQRILAQMAEAEARAAATRTSDPDSAPCCDAAEEVVRLSALLAEQREQIGRLEAEAKAVSGFFVWLIDYLGFDNAAELQATEAVISMDDLKHSTMGVVEELKHENDQQASAASSLRAEVARLTQERDDWEAIARTNFADQQAANDEVERLTERLAGLDGLTGMLDRVRAERDEALAAVARLNAELGGARLEVARLTAEARAWETEAVESRAVLEHHRQERDEAVRWIGVVRDELVTAGFPSGDRTVALASIRALLRERDEARGAADRMRAALTKYGRHKTRCNVNQRAPFGEKARNEWLDRGCDCGFDEACGASRSAGAGTTGEG